MIVVLIVAVLFIPWLYFWLLGHWFARVLALFIFAPICALLGALLTGAAPLLGLGLGAIVSWFVAGIPIYIWRLRLTPSY